MFRMDSPGNLGQRYLKSEQLSNQNRNTSLKRKTAIFSFHQLNILFFLIASPLKIMVSLCKILLDEEFLSREMSSLMKGHRKTEFQSRNLSTQF